MFGVQSHHADPVYRYYSADAVVRRYEPVKVQPSVAQAAMIGNPVSFPRVERLAAEYLEAAGERAFQVLQVTEQQIMDAMIRANRHGHIVCTQGGECFAGLLRARQLGLVDANEHAVLDATAHSLKFAGFQDMYFNNSFPAEYGIKVDSCLANKPELLLDPEQKTRLGEAQYTEAGAEAVARRLNLRKK
jgi:threonine synthase